MITNDDDPSVVLCRAQESEDCMDGWPIAKAYTDTPMEEDESWDGSSVVCDECYIALGCPDTDDLPI